jgi:SAM-dependent methyltransferase
VTVAGLRIEAMLQISVVAPLGRPPQQYWRKPVSAAAFVRIVRDYEKLEPGEGDTWNPLLCDHQLAYRLSLLYSLREALRVANVDVQRAQVLDVGCGNGRSTRLYLDFGFEPGQLHGVDLRDGAIARARRTHPAIRFTAYDGGELPVPDGSIDWVSLLTVISSVGGDESRAGIIESIRPKLRPGGHVFYYDLLRANDFAGGDRIHPARYFVGFDSVWSLPVRYVDYMPYQPEPVPPMSPSALLDWGFGAPGSTLSSIPRPKTLLRHLTAQLPPEIQKFLRKHAPSCEAHLFRKR